MRQDIRADIKRLSVILTKEMSPDADMANTKVGETIVQSYIFTSRRA